jgi:hypothetical protein
MTEKQRLEKELAELTSSRQTYKRITNNKMALQFLRENGFDYRELFGTQKEAIPAVRNLHDEIKNKQAGRRMAQRCPTFVQQLRRNHEKKVVDYLYRNYKTSTNGEIEAIIGNEFSYSNSSWLDYDGYSKSYGHPMTCYNHHVIVPAGWCEQKIEVVEFDGIRNWKCRKISQIGEVSIYDVVYLHEMRGFEKEFKSCFVASSGIYHYHAESQKKAIEGLRKKIKRNKTRYQITLDTYMSREKYHRLTGACREGITDWCESHGVDPTGRMKVRELLPILEQEKPWGYKEFIALISA